ncbi:hypothetical protein CYMTET_43300 [Cymbomonas tetramitiformis]|uniref:DUF1421 domain-containing protein n=1 Tax=Cymbomonas tetramitiformis TaxID=36881 RepID=A0AAE0C3K0_9CHLO|nr:hypothetical protein CYMTET_43300 [Cymbomonas tetramitiformis]
MPQQPPPPQQLPSAPPAAPAFNVVDRSQYEQMTRAAVERTMEKYRTDLLRVLENMNGRLVGLEKSCEQLALSVGELHTETTTQRENTDERLKALDLVSKEVARKVNILKDKMEVAETQKELEKASLETDTSTESQPPALPAPTSAPVPAEPSPQLSLPPPPQQAYAAPPAPVPTSAPSYSPVPAAAPAPSLLSNLHPQQHYAPPQYSGGPPPQPPPDMHYGPPPGAVPYTPSSGSYGRPPPPPPPSSQPSYSYGKYEQVVQEVSNMGFNREQVRSICNRLEQSGQAVDTNTVLDQMTR